mmetsp:Transcript_10156/g.37798  ORF Transcript_10156/g.37798 Transcript_10156/m.37798 type:complete len:357 (-) Transcript_10156:1377-2447(-)
MLVREWDMKSKKIRKIIRKFESAKGTHLTLFGTGKNIAAEQHLLQLLAMQFVANGFNRISMVKGGFMSAIKYISGGEVEYVRDEKRSRSGVQSKKNLSGNGMDETAGVSKVGDVDVTVDSVNNADSPTTTNSVPNTDTTVTTKLKELWSWGLTKATEYRVVKSHAPIDLDTLHENSTAHNFDSKRLMAFELDDSDDESIDIDTMLIQDEKADMGVSGDKASPQSTLEITTELGLLQKVLDTECDIYACTARSRSGDAPRFLILGRNILMLLKPHPTELNKSVVLWHRSLRQVVSMVHNPKTNAVRFRLKGQANQVLNADRNLQFNSEELRFGAEENMADKIEKFMELIQRTRVGTR